MSVRRGELGVWLLILYSVCILIILAIALWRWLPGLCFFLPKSKNWSYYSVDQRLKVHLAVIYGLEFLAFLLGIVLCMVHLVPFATDSRHLLYLVPWIILIARPVLRLVWFAFQITFLIMKAKRLNLPESDLVFMLYPFKSCKSEEGCNLFVAISSFSKALFISTVVYIIAIVFAVLQGINFNSEALVNDITFRLSLFGWTNSMLFFLLSFYVHWSLIAKSEDVYKKAKSSTSTGSFIDDQHWEAHAVFWIVTVLLVFRDGLLLFVNFPRADNSFAPWWFLLSQALNYGLITFEVVTVFSRPFLIWGKVLKFFLCCFTGTNPDYPVIEEREPLVKHKPVPVDLSHLQEESSLLNNIN